jgi:DNA-binding beta-propeller fold protein YncE
MLRGSILACCLVAGSAVAFAADPPDPILLGAGRHRYEWVKDWMKLPPGMDHCGPTHGGIVADAKNRIILSTDTDHAIMVFNPDGSFVTSFGKELGSGLHGLCIKKEGDAEFLYAAHLGHKTAVKMTLDGKVIWEIGYPKESGIYSDPNAYNPTGIAPLPDGGFVVADGYGTSWLHLYDKDGKYVRSFGGPGTEAGKFKTCHGLCLDTRGEKPLLLIADRENGRLQHFTLDGTPVKVYDQELRRPCLANVVNGDGDVFVPDLAGRATIFDKDMKLVTHLGDNSDPKLRAEFNVPKDKWKDGEFTAPHGGTWDHDGNLYVMDWNVLGRVTKLKRIRDAKSN